MKQYFFYKPCVFPLVTNQVPFNSFFTNWIRFQFLQTERLSVIFQTGCLSSRLTNTVSAPQQFKMLLLYFFLFNCSGLFFFCLSVHVMPDLTISRRFPYEELLQITAVLS